METKKKRRKQYARTVTSKAIESKIVGARDVSILNSFLYLLHRFQPWGSVANSLESGRAGYLLVELLCDALYEVAVAKRYWIRQPMDWHPPERVSFRAAFGDLVRHLFATHKVPSFMDHVWWSGHVNARQHRKWFRHIAKGYCVRGITEAQIQSKLAANRFMESPDHFSIDQALARAKNQAASSLQQRTSFGLTRRRVKRLIGGTTKNSWRRINVNDFYFTEFRWGVLNIWQIRQIRDRKKLIQEGKAMQHCVASYSDCCEKGKTTIWTMTRKIFDCEDARLDRTLTIEVLPNRMINQALGFRNRSSKPAEMEILRKWAEQENLRMGKYVS